MSNQPITKLKDGLLTATIWKNQTTEGKDHYSVEFNRAYLKDEQWHNSANFSGSELLRIAKLAENAYDRIKQLRKQAASREQVGA